MLPSLTTWLAWRPSERELLLLKSLFGIALVAWLGSAYNSVTAAQAAAASAQERLGQARAKFAGLSQRDTFALHTRQIGQLQALTMQDPTAQLSELRMREELTELAVRAVLSGLLVEDVPQSLDGLTRPAPPSQFAVLRMTLEADYDHAGFVRLLRELEQFYRGYLIDGVEVRSDGQKRRLRLALRILHQPGETGR